MNENADTTRSDLPDFFDRSKLSSVSFVSARSEAQAQAEEARQKVASLASDRPDAKDFDIEDEDTLPSVYE